MANSSRGFVPVVVLIIAVILGSIGVGAVAYHYYSQPKNPPTVKPKIIPPTSTSSATPATPAAIPTAPPPPAPPAIPKTNVGTIKIHTLQLTVCQSEPINCFQVDSDNPIKLPDRMTLRIINTDTNTRYEKAGVADWTASDLPPGHYKAMVYFRDPYIIKTGDCQGCTNSNQIWETGMCGYEFDLKANDSPRVVCKFNNLSDPITSSSVPNSNSNSNSNSAASDTTPPTTNIYYPQNGGSITYKIDGKVCAITTAPTDNNSSSGKIDTQYAFDGGSFSSWASGQGYLCADSLPNGSHTMQYHSKDEAGNIESARTLTFTVNIPGN